MFSLCSKHNRKVMWNQREKEEINWRAEERRFHGSTFCSFLHVSAFHDHALWNALKTWEPLLCVIQFQARPLPSAHTDKTAWDGKSTWINIYYGRCCFRQVLFRGNLLWIHRCYGNNLLIEVFLQSFVLWCSKQVHVGFTMKGQCIMDICRLLPNKELVQWYLFIFVNKSDDQNQQLIDSSTYEYCL